MKDEILKLNHNECYTVPESDYGKAEIWNIHGHYILFEIPQFGGKPMYVNSYPKYRIDEMMKKIESWT